MTYAVFSATLVPIASTIYELTTLNILNVVELFVALVARGQKTKDMLSYEVVYINNS